MPKKTKSKTACGRDTPPTPITAKERRKLDESINKHLNPIVPPGLTAGGGLKLDNLDAFRLPSLFPPASPPGAD